MPTQRQQGNVDYYQSLDPQQEEEIDSLSVAGMWENAVQAASLDMTLRSTACDTGAPTKGNLTKSELRRLHSRSIGKLCKISIISKITRISSAN